MEIRANKIAAKTRIAPPAAIAYDVFLAIIKVQNKNLREK